VCGFTRQVKRRSFSVTGQVQAPILELDTKVLYSTPQNEIH